MSMMWPPQSVKIVSTPSFLSARATRWPPDIRAASLLFGRSVSSAVVGVGALGAATDAVLTAFILPPVSRNVYGATDDAGNRSGGTSTAQRLLRGRCGLRARILLARVLDAA